MIRDIRGKVMQGEGNGRAENGVGKVVQLTRNGDAHQDRIRAKTQRR